MIEGHPSQHFHPLRYFQNAAWKLVHEIEQKSYETEEVSRCIVDKATCTATLESFGTFPVFIGKVLAKQ